MPLRFTRLISFAVAKSLSPNSAGFMKVTLACWATLAALRLLQAKAKALSESVKIIPPWQIPCPFMCCSLISKDKVAVPSFTYSKHIPIDRQVLSRSNIFEATFFAVSVEFIGTVPCFVVCVACVISRLVVLTAEAVQSRRRYVNRHEVFYTLCGGFRVYTYYLDFDCA